MNVYVEHGYINRADYLECMAEDYGLPIDIVQSLADISGPSEDFDGLVIALEDASELAW